MPETQENEFKTEHYKRLAHVNHVYDRSASKPGWKTDRGRICIILGGGSRTACDATFSLKHREV
jgi:GWxTD domain-containing protein